MAGATSLDHRYNFFEHINWTIVIAYVSSLLLKSFLRSFTYFHDDNFIS